MTMNDEATVNLKLDKKALELLCSILDTTEPDDDTPAESLYFLRFQARAALQKINKKA